jgi:hypothetical protein
VWFLMTQFLPSWRHLGYLFICSLNERSPNYDLKLFFTWCTTPPEIIEQMVENTKENQFNSIPNFDWTNEDKLEPNLNEKFNCVSLVVYLVSVYNPSDNTVNRKHFNNNQVRS